MNINCYCHGQVPLKSVIIQISVGSADSALDSQSRDYFSSERPIILVNPNRDALTGRLQKGFGFSYSSLLI